MPPEEDSLGVLWQEWLDKTNVHTKSSFLATVSIMERKAKAWGPSGLATTVGLPASAS